MEAIQDNKVEVDVQTTNGIRHGVIRDGSIYAKFPRQAMTTSIQLLINIKDLKSPINVTMQLRKKL